jgi:predicted nucleic acid-binding protein
MIIVDNNILSTFAKIGRLDVLFRLFPQRQIAIVPAVYNELRFGIRKGHVQLEDVMEMVEKKSIRLITLTEAEIFLKPTLPVSFDEGELESVAACKFRKITLLTNERSVKNWCVKEDIKYADLPDLLRACWRSEVMSKKEVKTLIEEIEEKDNITFKSKEEIFKD